MELLHPTELLTEASHVALEGLHSITRHLQTGGWAEFAEHVTSGPIVPPELPEEIHMGE